MTHPLTPREKVRKVISGAEIRVEYDSVGRQYAFVRDAVGTADAILTALASGSGDHSGGVTDMIDHAELAALREHRITADLLVSTLKADKAEAERKLAEAVGLKHLTDGQIFAAINAAVTITRDRNGVDNGAVCISPEKFRTFLSKESERG